MAKKQGFNMDFGKSGDKKTQVQWFVPFSGEYLYSNYVCHHCGFENPRKNLLRRHLLKSCRKRNCRPPPKVRGKHVCSCCKKTFKNQKTLDQHYRARSSQIVICAHCDYKSNRKRSLVRHLKVRHFELKIRARSYVGQTMKALKALKQETPVLEQKVAALSTGDKLIQQTAVQCQALDDIEHPSSLDLSFSFEPVMEEVLTNEVEIILPQISIPVPEISSNGEYKPLAFIKGEDEKIYQIVEEDEGLTVLIEQVVEQVVVEYHQKVLTTQQLVVDKDSEPSADENGSEKEAEQTTLIEEDEDGERISITAEDIHNMVVVGDDGSIIQGDQVQMDVPVPDVPLKRSQKSKFDLPPNLQWMTFCTNEEDQMRDFAERKFPAYVEQVMEFRKTIEGDDKSEGTSARMALRQFKIRYLKVLQPKKCMVDGCGQQYANIDSLKRHLKRHHQ